MKLVYKNIPLEVDFEIEPVQHGGPNDPSWPPYVVLQSVEHCGVDITELLSDSVIIELETMIEAELSEPDIANGEDEAEYFESVDF